LKQFNKALTVNPKHYLTLAYKANLLGSLGQYHNALTLFDQALQINPTFQFGIQERKKLVGLMSDIVTVHLAKNVFVCM
jgi:tetratricopeptide (TPR) repeat protein